MAVTSSCSEIGVEDGDQLVVAVLAGRADAEVQVDLRRDPHGDRLGNAEQSGRGHASRVVRGPGRTRQAGSYRSTTAPFDRRSSSDSRSGVLAGRTTTGCTPNWICSTSPAASSDCASRPKP